MNNIQRLTAAMAAAALLLGSAGPALAKENGHGKGPETARVSEKFEDMGDFQWGLSDVTKMEVKGIFKGRDAKLFAPGAKITHQEAAVAALRLINKEADSQALSITEVGTLLNSIPDKADIAIWARPAVAELVKLGIVSPDKPFYPTKDATRLDTAVLLVKALGHEAEAQEAMKESLNFKDANQIPAELSGYVYVAVQLRLIAGYEDVTFRPHQAVKRVEMAVMMGRADGLIDRHRQDEVRGTLKSVDATAKTVTITKVGGQDVTLTLADDASIFVQNQEKSLADLTAGMTLMVKLDETGKVKYIEAKLPEQQGTAVNGTISALVAPTTTALGLITIGNNIYPVAANATVTLNNNAATFADLKVGDTVALTINAGLATKIAITRQQETTVSGPVSAVTAPTATVAGSIAVNATNYALPASATVYVYGNQTPVTFADIHVGDTATLTLVSNQVTKVVVTHQEAAINGAIAALTAPSATALGQITIGTTVYPVAANATFSLNGTAVTFAYLKVGDTVALTIANNQVSKVVATRAQTVINGAIIGLIPAVAANGTTPASPAKIQVSYTANNTATLTTYSVDAITQFAVSGTAKLFSDLQLGDSAKLTLWGDLLAKVEVTR